MTVPFGDIDELRALLDALCEESITDEQVRRLETLVLSHPEAEAYYVQFMSLQADLTGHFAARGLAAGGALPVRGQAAARRRSRRVLWGVLGGLGLAAAVLLAVFLWPRRPGQLVASGPPPEELDGTVAVLLHAPGAEWDETGRPPRASGPLPPGLLRLKSGLAHIEFYCGATVILEGPAEFHLRSRTEGFCASGKLRATVPPTAHGFTIGSPKLHLVDRGTEFGLAVGTDGQTEVHVFQGQVDLHDPNDGTQAPPHTALTTGQSVRLDKPGEIRPITPTPAAFQTAQDLTRRSEDRVRRRHRDWLAAGEALRRDPDLLVYYPFEAGQPWDRSLPDQAQARKQPRDGTLIGCAWVAGRWAGKQGLEFKRVSDRVRLYVPGEFASLTLAAWVRVDGLPNQNNSLMMSDGWDPGELHWQIGNDGTLILGVQSNPKRGFSYHAIGALTPDRFGQWLHLAVTYDQHAGQVTHYLDGKAVSHVPTQFDIPLRIGDAELGNWNIATHRNNHPVRFLNGCMDEFLMFSRALSEVEVARLYSQGRPPQ